MSKVFEHSRSFIFNPAGENIKSKQVIVFASFGMIFTGVAYILLLKYQMLNGFKHTFTQTSFIFIGKYMNIFLFNLPKITGIQNIQNHFDDLKLRAIIKEKDPNLSKLTLGYSSFLEVVTVSLQLFAILMLPLST